MPDSGHHFASVRKGNRHRRRLAAVDALEQSLNSVSAFTNERLAFDDVPALEPISHPCVLPAWAQLYAVRTGLDDGIGSLGAGAGRPREFATGRWCAAQALRLLGAPSWQAPIGVGGAGEPLWPAGYTGSIARAGDVTVAAVATLECAVSIGIDTELVHNPGRPAPSSHLALHACETRLKARGLDAATLFTLTYSAKEALFKCLYPLVLRRFDYRDAAVRAIDMFSQTLLIELLTSLGNGFHRGRQFRGQFDVRDGLVGTGFMVDARRVRPSATPESKQREHL